MSETPKTLTKLAIRLEHFETPEWAVRAILNKERLIGPVLDPCCGTGVLAEAAIEAGYHVVASDIHDWGYPGQHAIGDFLRHGDAYGVGDFSVLMNPPFSKAVEFVQGALDLEAPKILCFQRLAWWESLDRREFWEKNPPARVYICGERATCWRHDLPKDEKGNRFDPVTGRKLSNAPTAHAWFVWDSSELICKGDTQLGHIWKADAQMLGKGRAA